MPILSQDIKLLKSEQFNDSESGGGRSTKTGIIDNSTNNMFESVSTIDRTVGRVNIRSIFPSVETQTNDIGLGAHLIVAKLAGDTKQELTLITNDKEDDRRPDMVAKLESYLKEGTRTNYFLYGTAFEGSLVVNLITEVGAKEPEIGDVFTLISSTDVNYIKIDDFTTEIQTFVDAQGSYQKLVIACIVKSPLKYTFLGVDASRFTPLTNLATVIKTAIVADSTQYHSSKLTTSVIPANGNNVEVSSMFTQLVPSSQTDIAMLDIPAVAGNLPFNSATTSDSTLSVSLGSTYFVGTAIAPNSLVLAGLTVKGQDIKQGSVVVANIDYKNGKFTKVGGGTVNLTGTYKVGAFATGYTNSKGIDVTINNRALVYVFNTTIGVSVGSVSVRYRALGDWLTISDNGDGTLGGDGTGSGTINYQTGSGSVTLEALPDVGSGIVISFATNNSVKLISGSAVDVNNSAAYVNIKTRNIAFSATTFIYTDSNDVVRTANGNPDGTISGAATGNYDSIRDIITIRPTFAVKQGTNIATNISKQGLVRYTVSNVLSNLGVVTITLPHTNIVQGSVRLEVDAPVNVATAPVTTIVRDFLSSHSGSTFAGSSGARSSGFTFGMTPPLSIDWN